MQALLAPLPQAALLLLLLRTLLLLLQQQPCQLYLCQLPCLMQVAPQQQQQQQHFELPRFSCCCSFCSWQVLVSCCLQLR